MAAKGEQTVETVTAPNRHSTDAAVERADSLGQFAAEIAYHLDDAIAPIRSSALLLRQRVPQEAPLIDLIDSAVQVATDKIQQLLIFCREIEGGISHVRSEAIFAAVEEVIRQTFPLDIQLRTGFSGVIPTVVGDAARLERALLNLCDNARDAMPNGGVITIEAEAVIISGTYSEFLPEAKPGRYVAWHVSDTGFGVPADAVERVFEPFFTTKFSNQHMGLGLALVNRVVKSHGGFIQVFSALGRGSTFSLYLPAVPPPVEQPVAPAPELGPSLPESRTVLIVDSDPRLRSMIRATLAPLNFRVMTTEDGRAALRLAAEAGPSLALAIVSTDMPGIDVATFVRLLKDTMPYVEIVATSSDFEAASLRELDELGIRQRLRKPFTLDGLSEMIELALAGHCVPH